MLAPHDDNDDADDDEPPPEMTRAEVRALPRFVPPLAAGRVVSVYDGDTLTVASRVPGLVDSPCYKFTVRLRGVDTPELRTRDADEKSVARLARDQVRALALHRMVELRNLGREKYGRLLCEVWLSPDTPAATAVSPEAVGPEAVGPEAVSLGEWLLSRRLAVRYDGGKKSRPESWVTYYHHGHHDPHDGT
jgi:micrococcal nuclease